MRDIDLIEILPDDDSDFTPELARKIILEYQRIIKELNEENEFLVRVIDDR